MAEPEERYLELVDDDGYELIFYTNAEHRGKIIPLAVSLTRDGYTHIFEFNTSKLEDIIEIRNFLSAILEAEFKKHGLL